MGLKYCQILINKILQINYVTVYFLNDQTLLRKNNIKNVFILKKNIKIFIYK